MAMKPGKFPTTVFITQENIGRGDDEYLAVNRDEESGLESSDDKFVAVYDLREIRRGRLVARFEDTNFAPKMRPKKQTARR